LSPGGFCALTLNLAAELFGHRIPAPIFFAPIGINKLYSPLGELVPAKIAGELGLPVCSAVSIRSQNSRSPFSTQYCLSTAASQSIEAVAAANDEGASSTNESNAVHSYDGPNGGNAKGPRFYQLYMGHDDEIVRYGVYGSSSYVSHSHLFVSEQTISLLERAWKSGFDVLMLTVDTWQLGWRPTDINIANYVYEQPSVLLNCSYTQFI
jgi:isopentenyl diphosphate isomerase/L-lactate dehydrogenase-like FMN-dependent dehydrogenase